VKVDVAVNVVEGLTLDVPVLVLVVVEVCETV
jgi:hypothetical protein